MIPVKPKEKHPEYILGHSDKELERLIRQSSYYNHTTEELLNNAGLEPGMTVLDVGCGAGDVAFLAAQMVGPKGKVVAIDQSPDALALAEYRAGKLGLDNITFVQADLNSYGSSSRFDAVIGRLILLYQREPVGSLNHLISLVRPGGKVVFQEFNMGAVNSWPAFDFFDRHARIVTQTFEMAGMDPLLGCRLFFYMEKAGLKEVQTIAHTKFVAGEMVHGAAEYLSDTVRSVLPFARRLGVPLPDDLDLEQLPHRLMKNCQEHQIALTMPMVIGAWGTV